MNRLLTSRILLLSGLTIGLASFVSTVSHIFDPNYLLIPSADAADLVAQSHAKYHALREAFGDVAGMSILLLIFFGSASYRNSLTWVISLLLMLGYYAPFWAGAPFSEGLSAPNLQAEFAHVAMASLSVTALFVGRPMFLLKQS